MDPSSASSNGGGGGVRVEFQAVILAGGAGNRLYPLSEGVPKCLLPIANRSLLAYQLELLERSGKFAGNRTNLHIYVYPIHVVCIRHMWYVRPIILRPLRSKSFAH